jgi:hypothetical protein
MIKMGIESLRNMYHTYKTLGPRLGWAVRTSLSLRERGSLPTIDYLHGIANKYNNLGIRFHIYEPEKLDMGTDLHRGVKLLTESENVLSLSHDAFLRAVISNIRLGQVGLGDYVKRLKSRIDSGQSKAEAYTEAAKHDSQIRQIISLIHLPLNRILRELGIEKVSDRIVQEFLYQILVEEAPRFARPTEHGIDLSFLLQSTITKGFKHLEQKWEESSHGPTIMDTPEEIV